MKLTIIIALLAQASLALAASPQSKLSLELQQSSDPVQVLKNAFDSAKPAHMQDIPRIADLTVPNPKLKCVTAGTGPVGTFSVDLSPAAAGQFNYVVPGTPDDGPLFPGTPEQTVTSLAPIMYMPAQGQQINDNDIVISLQRSRLTMPALSTSKTGDIQATLKYYDDSSYADTITYRINNGEIFVHEAIKTNDYSADGYAYCY